MQAAISDAFIDELTAMGDEGRCAQGIERYREAGASSPCIGPIAKTDFDGDAARRRRLLASRSLLQAGPRSRAARAERCADDGRLALGSR